MAKFVELLLTVLQYHTEGLLEIADVFLSTPAESGRKFHRIPAYERQWFKKNWAEMYHNRQQFYATLNNLKRQGLIRKKITKGKSNWFLTKSGREKIQKYGEFRRDPFSSASVVFPRPHGEGMTIVAFDIPEKERRKRDWIRACLTGMNFKMLQKSVWIAQGQIDEDFFRALRDRSLLDKVHIFAIAKQGTIHSAGL